MASRVSHTIVLIKAHYPLFARISNSSNLPLFILSDAIQTLWHKCVSLKCLNRSICTRTIIPRVYQHFLKIIVRRTKFSGNFGPPDQNFYQTKISMIVPPCMVFGDHYYLQLGDYFYNSIGVLQQADVEQATQNGKLAIRLVPHLKTHHG